MQGVLFPLNLYLLLTPSEINVKFLYSSGARISSKVWSTF